MTDSSHDPAEDPKRSFAPPRDEVMAQLDRTLSNRAFAQSDRMRKFLRFVVEEALAGRGDALKEYTIAVEVFERDDSFDPQTSSIVRVEASRLRGKLEQYNAIDGRDDPLHIELPPGGYAPTFRAASPAIEPSEEQSDPHPPGRARRFGPRWAAGLVGALIIVIGASTLFVLYPKSGTDRSLEASKPGPIYSVAVLPLRNISGDAGNDYFSDGMTDALIASLAKRSVVRVISMTSVMGYKGVNRPVADIARELNVSHVIEGSVLRVGDRVRITAQLIEAKTDRHIWAESYERNVADVLAIQDEVIRHIVSSLSGQVAAAKGFGPKDTPKDVPAIDPAAYESQLRGRFFRNQMTAEGFYKSIDYFKKAIEIEPGYALAYSGMASCFCLLSGQGFELVRPKEAMPTAKAAAMKALELDDSLAEPHAFLGFIRLKYDWDWPGAEASLKHSLQLNPSFAQARLFYSIYLEAMERQDEAIEEAERARAIDPLSLAVNVNLGWQYLQAGRLEQARRLFETTAELNPDFWSVHWGLGHYFRQKGMYGKAIAEFREAIDAGGGHTLPLKALGYTYGVAGKSKEARKVLERLKALAGEGYVSPFNMATIHVGLGETEEAFAWLDKAYEERSRSLVWLKVAKEYDGLRSDPRFKTLLRRIGLPD